ncbi:Spermidine/putrescine transport system permease protein PotB [bacterium HR40]|nr:Spermidine/putrescine transport system permease protein PotB [bacterium HR40]
MSSGALASLDRRLLSGLCWLLAAIWVFGLVLLPQLFMIETSLWWLERDPQATALSQRIDRLYQEVMLRELDLQAAPVERRPLLEDEIARLREEIALLEAREQQPVKVYGFANYARMSGLHLQVFLRTLAYSVLVTLLSLAVCYPVAWTAARARSRRGRALLLLALVIPYAINELLRVYAWLMIFDYEGLLNALLVRLGLVDRQSGGIPFLTYPFTTFVAMVYAYILFMVFPLYNAFESLDEHQVEAARDLGASTWLLHRRVVVPHARPGIAVGCVMTFMLSAGSYSVPQIMSRGLGGDWFSQLVYRQFFEANNWNIGAAYAFSLLLACLVFVGLVMRLFRVGIREIAR